MQQRNQEFAATHYNSGFAYGYIDTSDSDIEDHNKTIAITPHGAETYNVLGIAHNKKGEYDLAISSFSKAIELNPEHAGAYNDRGVACHRKLSLPSNKASRCCLP